LARILDDVGAPLEQMPLSTSDTMLLRRAPDFIEPFLPSPAEHPPSGPNRVHEIKYDGFPGYRPRWKSGRPSVGRSFIIRPFPLMGTTKNPARNDRTRAVPPKCAA
jgi:hypothetical protein